MTENYLETEEQIISLLLNDKEVTNNWHQNHIGQKYFDKAHHNILGGVSFAFNNDVQLTRQTFKSFLLDYKKLTPQESAAEVSLYNRCLMRPAKKDDLPMLLEAVKIAFIRRNTAQHFNEYRKEKENLGDIKANRSLIKKLSALEASTTEEKPISIEIRDAKDPYMAELEHRRKNPLSRLICEIPEIDETMDVGFRPGHLTLFCAEVGVFKTSMMVNVALNIFKQSNETANVLFIPLEMPPGEILNKIVARETRVPLHLIEHADKLTDEQVQQIADEMEKWKEKSQRFQIMGFKGRSKVSLIRREIEKQLDYFQPRMVFVDYADKLAPEERSHRSDLEMQYILDDLRTMGSELGFGVVTAAQLVRDALKKLAEQKDGKQQLGTADIRGGQVMAAESDTVYAQMRNPALPNEELILFCIKSRHGKNIFNNGRNKATLKIQPDIGLIESPNSLGWDGTSSDKLLSGLATPPLAIDEAPEDEDGSPF